MQTPIFFLCSFFHSTNEMFWSPGGPFVAARRRVACRPNAVNTLKRKNVKEGNQRPFDNKKRAPYGVFKQNRWNSMDGPHEGVAPHDPIIRGHTDGNVIGSAADPTREDDVDADSSENCIDEMDEEEHECLPVPK
ncbi:hypothetical protein TW95_gp0482 [Pandoravirus inopinatum]|uniref:Uncharacterized protein n=1 Tax=Pandoravirus inopinatum TaxID=1605721 RepID=A0A0B5J8V8_9VIRU|nr:hypothetical protein TW95_gp0482 [Pandoravirus inopinatum]AJF97216.1 hypothetical protein [Pandoravirus inopinatum]